MVRARKPTTREMIESIAHYQQEATALRWLIKDLCPSQGWRFISSPRGYHDYLVHVDADGAVAMYAALDDRDRERRRDVELYEMSIKEGDATLFSFLEACAARTEYRSRMKVAL